MAQDLVSFKCQERWRETSKSTKIVTLKMKLWFFLENWLKMSIKPKSSERNGTVKGKEASIWSRAITANSEWPDKVS